MLIFNLRKETLQDAVQPIGDDGMSYVASESSAFLFKGILTPDWLRHLKYGII